MSEWTQISTDDDFSGAAVFEGTSANGPVFRVVFANKEPRPTLHRAIFGGVFLALTALWIWGIAARNGISAVAVFLLLLWIIGGALWLSRPWPTTRAIDLDLGTQRFRVSRNGHTTYERSLGAFHNLSVDDHPDLEIERNSRRERNQKGPGPLEKQHCLFGWFGAEGGERAELVYRVEWPKRYTLQEIAGAVNWTIKKMAASVEPAAPAAQATAARAPVAADKPAATGSLNPPLD